MTHHRSVLSHWQTLVLVFLITACSSDATKLSSPDTTASSTCSASSASALVPGQVTTPLSGTSLCVGGGSGGAEYALVAFNGSTVPTATASVVLQSNGTSAPSSSILTNVIASRTLAIDLSGSGASALASEADVGGFHARLRATESGVLTRLIPGARRAVAARQSGSAVLRDVIPSSVQVGQFLRLNTNADSACTDPSYSIGRVVAVTSKAIVVADTANPAGGYTDAEYQSIAVTFDTLVDPLDTKNFGQPSDIDGNGHVVLFFTRSVNALTPAGSSSYIGGFFFARDLFPTSSTSDFEGCASSNYGEMFYLMVADPSGTINGNARSKSMVTTSTIGTVAHEYQHLINAARRMYVNTSATSFEEVWLNEGLSHVAEELLFYAQANLQPRQDLDATLLRSSQTYISAFNSDASANLGRFREFLVAPATSSPYADNDSLSTRGATWSFLRYAVDRQGTTDSNMWYQLVNSSMTGLDNLQQVFGTGLAALFRDWATSALSDDVAGVATTYQQPSWNFRSIYDASSGSYPLNTVSLTAGSTTTLTADGGSAAYARFSVANGGAGQVVWGALPSNVQLTLVRMK